MSPTIQDTGSDTNIPAFDPGAPKGSCKLTLHKRSPASPQLLERLQALRQYHADAVERLKDYADDAGLRDSDIKHYGKRADIHALHVDTIDQLLGIIH